jgi:hypothetical protein
MPQSHNPPTPASTDSPPRRHGWLLLGLIGFWMAAVLTAGLVSEVSLGDEVVHVRFAQNIQSQGGLTCYDELFGTPHGKGLRFQETPLWPIGLVGLWQLVPGEPLWVAQVYQAFWGALLIGAAYLLGRAVHDSRTGLWAALLTASAPAVVLYSTVLYMDVPYVAVGVLALWAVIARRYALAGLLLVACFAVKINGIFLLAPLGWVAAQQVLYPHVRWWEGFASLALTGIGLVVALYYGAGGGQWLVWLLWIGTLGVILKEWFLSSACLMVILAFAMGTPFAFIPLALALVFRHRIVRRLDRFALARRLLHRPAKDPWPRPSFPTPPGQPASSPRWAWKVMRLAGVAVLMALPVSAALYGHRMLQAHMVRQYNIEQAANTQADDTDASTTTAAPPRNPHDTSLYSVRNILDRFFNKPLVSRERLASSMLDREDIATFFGGPLAIGALAILGMRVARWGEPVDGRLLAVLVLLYLMVAVVIFSLNSEIRYLLPAFPVLAVVVGRRCAGWFTMRTAAVAVVAVCLLQLAGAATMVGRERRKSPELMNAYRRIREHVPAEAYILYPGQELVIYANRRLVWGKTQLMNILFWPPSPLKAQVVMQYNEIRYVAIPKDRIYDDTGFGMAERHYNGYPRSLVDSMAEWPFAERVAWIPEDAPLIVYRIRWSDLPEEEIRRLIEEMYDTTGADEAAVYNAR